MAATLLPSGGIALVGAPDSDMAFKDARVPPVQAMQLDISQDIIDELLESVRSGKPPQILFGRTPQLKYGDKTHALQSSPEAFPYELYQSGDDELDFAGLINHSVTVQKAEDVTAGVDTALEQLKSSMAAISDFKEANKTIVGNATGGRSSNHRRFPSSSFRPQHLAPSTAGSPQPSGPNSPMTKKPPTSQPGSNHELILVALRTPLIHLLAVQPSRDAYLAETCRTSLAIVRELLPKIAKRSSDDADKWQLTDKSFRELNPWKFTYKNSQEREQAIENAIKSFDRLRLAKDDKLWQILLPREERGQGKCLSRLNVKAPEAKPATPLHKMPKLDKKPAAKKVDAKDGEKGVRKAREVKEAEPKPKKTVKEKPTAKPTPAAAASRVLPSTETPKIRTKKAAPVGDTSSAPRVKPKMSARDLNKDRAPRPHKPVMPVNTKPKNPSPLSASPPVNASDFEDNHPVHKALSAAPSPVKNAAANSDRSLKRKANDIDSDIHNHNLSVKKPHIDRATPNRTPSSINGRLNGSTPSSANSVKRKSDESSTSNTPTTKVRKVTHINTTLASRYPNNSQVSPSDSSSTTSPSLPSLSFRQTVELSQKFQKYYKKYEELYWQLAESSTPPTEAQRNDLLKMHKKLEEMKREIKAGAGVHR
ncbi:hypothetical protein BS50DRAFT_494050 [Corynespora cassiicola Philippines]|uniref:Uncharacterized protein n=1 Tax=Corynespora cassiicola Philippines TaxID=1448308 RepID=A0A2T2NP50_CORCC|nr:hypothetical protein BS50DRAFT_494050 [Corynespora cassiicola Philippines]